MDPYSQYSQERPNFPTPYHWESPKGGGGRGASSFFKGGGGSPQGIGPMEEIGPGGAHAGRIIGLVPALHLAGDIGGPLTAAALAARKRAKDFNDEDVDNIEGASRGKPMLGPGRPPPRFSGDPEGDITDRDNPIY